MPRRKQNAGTQNVTTLDMEQIHEGAQRIFQVKQIKIIEFSTLHYIWFTARSNAENVPWGTLEIEFNRFQQAALPCVVFPNKQVHPAQLGDGEVAE
jgi:hypothetical protein